MIPEQSKVKNKASMAFRLAALNGSKRTSPISKFYNRLKTRLGTPKAITATARKLACIFYKLLKYGQTYIEQGIEAYDKKYNEMMVKKLKKHASILGFDLVKIAPIL